MRVEDGESAGTEWDEILKNERINRAFTSNSTKLPLPLMLRCSGRILPAHLSNLMSAMVEKNVAIYEPLKQTSSILVYWRLPEEWAEILYDWVRPAFLFMSRRCTFPIYITQVISTGQLNTILTFLDITDPPVESPLRNIPISLLRKAISILGKTGRSQIISITDGEGVRFLARAR